MLRCVMAKEPFACRGLRREEASSHLCTAGSSPHLWEGSGGNKQLHISPCYRSPPHPKSTGKSLSHGQASLPRTGQPQGPLTLTWHLHWEHLASVQWLPDSYTTPRCQQGGRPAARLEASGPLGEGKVPTASPWRKEGGLRDPNREALGTGVAVGVTNSLGGAEEEDTGVEDAAGRVVLPPAARYPGAPGGGLCPGGRTGRPASGSNRSILAGCWRGCMIADGASTAFGKAEKKAQGPLRQAKGQEAASLSSLLPAPLWVLLHLNNGEVASSDRMGKGRALTGWEMTSCDRIRR